MTSFVGSNYCSAPTDFAGAFEGVTSSTGESQFAAISAG